MEISNVTPIRKLCKECKVNVTHRYKFKKDGSPGYRTKCSSCLRKHKTFAERHRMRPWVKHKKETCEKCNFIPQDSCQLDVDHIDGDKKNNLPQNLMTLCANCHRLKTKLSREYGALKYRRTA